MRLKFSLPRVINTPEHQPDKQAKLWVISVASIALVAHFFIGNIIVNIFACCVLLIKTRITQLDKNNPPRWAMILLVCSCTILILIQYGGWSGHKAGISFLTTLLALKLLEAKNQRDYFVACLLMYFLAAVSFLFSTSPLAIIAVILFSIGVTSAMCILSSPKSFNPLGLIKQSCWMMLKAIPLTILLFFFFPRIEADFGFLPGQGDAQSEGFGNKLSTGDFADNAFSTELAFRVEFKGEKPDTANLYWRNKTMTKEHNFSWQAANRIENFISLQISTPTPQLNEFKYEILQEASKDKYLTVLDYVSYAEHGKLLKDFSVLKKRNIKGSFSYQARSSLRAIQNVTELKNRQHYLQIHTTPSQRTAKLLSSWKQQARSKQELINLTLNYFRQQPFKYSLLPPALGRNPADEFLFKTRTGYCEHYASAFTLIMRWLDIPARIIVGFQGGEWNAKGNYYAVRYSDAHAWSEVWLKDKGWIRVDPTAMIAPERIEFGMDALLALWEENGLQSNLTGRALSDLLRPRGFNKSLHNLRQTLGNMSYQWNKWIVNYNLETQKALLQSLGLDNRYFLRNLVLIMFLGSALLIAFYFWRLLPKQKKIDETEKLYRQFCNILAKKGLIKSDAEGAYSFAKRAEKHFPQSATDIQRITQYYIRQRYGKYPQDISIYKRLIKEFRRN